MQYFQGIILCEHEHINYMSIWDIFKPVLVYL